MHFQKPTKKFQNVVRKCILTPFSHPSRLFSVLFFSLAVIGATGCGGTPEPAPEPTPSTQSDLPAGKEGIMEDER